MSDEVTGSLSAFAKFIGCRQSYVSQLKRDDRLLLTADGKVRFEASKQRIRDTRDPSHDAVAQRHAQARGGALAVGDGGAPDPAAPAATDPPGTDGDTLAAINPQYANARAKREHFAALTAERDYEVSIGKLVRAEDVSGAIRSAVIDLRKRLEALPRLLAPQLVGVAEESRIASIIAAEVEHALRELSRQFGAVVKADP